MKSSYISSEAKKFISKYSKLGINKDIALRIYTTRLLGLDPSLVLHGGGNTSVKTKCYDLMGNLVEILCVKGSGWEMSNIEPQGLPAVRLDRLLELRELKNLSDQEMVNCQRSALINTSSPNPSVETLLHAFLPHKFVDHTHSTSVLALTDQEKDEQLLHKVYGNKVCLVPYVKPGFDLAIEAIKVFEKNPQVEGMILRKHGIFTFGKTAEESYLRMIKLVSIAERIIAKGKKKSTIVKFSNTPAKLSDVAPIIRGHLAIPSTDIDIIDPARMILDFRTNKIIRNYVDGSDIQRYSQIGVVTPDHTIRTKNYPLILPFPEHNKLSNFSKSVLKAVNKYSKDYLKYFARHNGKREKEKIMLDTIPRVVLIPGLGIFGVGKNPTSAKIAADIAENTIRVISDAESIGQFKPVSEADMFDVEYWSLEQLKLGNSTDLSFVGKVVLVTGGASGIGSATARAFWSEGATVVVLDQNIKAAEKISSSLGDNGLAISCDVTNPKEVRAAFDSICRKFGGVDVVVSNAGAAWQGAISEISNSILRKSFELNFFSHQNIAQNAVRVMKAQGTGGALLFNASKQAVNPGQDFGPYGLPKAATLFLSKQYALECGVFGITSNAINADRVNTGIFAKGFLEKRAAARGLTPEEYLRTGNLLQREVKAEDVAQAFVDLARSRKTTAATLTVDGGNISASLR